MSYSTVNDLTLIQNNLIKMYDDNSLFTKDNLSHSITLITKLINEVKNEPYKNEFLTIGKDRTKYKESLNEVFKGITDKQFDFIVNNRNFCRVFDSNWGPFGGYNCPSNKNS